MLKKIQNNKKLIENIISLFSLRGLEYLLGFITFPYLVRVLGPTNYGAMAFAQSLAFYFIMVVDYGFNLTGPRKIALSPKSEHGKIFMSIFYAKFILLFICTILLAIILNIFNEVFIEKEIFWAAYLSVLGNAIFPIWFFLGIQKMRYITLVNLLSRLITTLCIFLLVTTPNDYVLATLFQAVVPIFAGIFSFIILIQKYDYLFVKCTICDIKNMFIDSWDIFISNIASSIYSVSNTFFLGLLTNNTIVGYFSSAKKIIDAIVGLSAPIAQALFPYINEKIAKSKQDTIIFIKKCTFIICGSNFIISISILLFTNIFIEALLGNSFKETELILKIMSFLPFITSISELFGVQTLIPFGYKNIFSKIVVSSAFLNLIIIFPFIYYFQAEGAALAILITSVFYSFMCWYALKKHNISILL